MRWKDDFLFLFFDKVSSPFTFLFSMVSVTGGQFLVPSFVANAIQCFSDMVHGRDAMIIEPGAEAEVS